MKLKTQNSKLKTILGIDPGTTVLGYGVIALNGNQTLLITLGVLHLNKINGHHLKLKKIFERIKSLIKEFHPDEIAIEAPFYGKNVQSMLKLGRAQGVTIAASMMEDIPIYEYAPKKIKQSITGNGNASKEQVAAMLQQILKFKETSKFLDATDGLAAAVCHSFQGVKLNDGKSFSSKKSYSGWRNFVEANPGRIKK